MVSAIENASYICADLEMPPRVRGSMNSILSDVPLWHQFRDEVLPDIVANRPVEGEPLLNYIRNF